MVYHGVVDSSYDSLSPTSSGDAAVPHDQNDPSGKELKPNHFFRGPWFWVLLVLLILFPVVGTLTSPGSPQEPAPEETETSAPVESSSTPSVDPSVQAEASEVIDGGELLTVANENSLDYWQSVVTKVVPGENGSLKVFIQGGNPDDSAPKIQKSIVSKTAKKVCERFAEDLTDGQTTFSLVDTNGDLYASNMDEGGSIDECVSPLVEEIEVEDKAKESEKAAEKKAEMESESK